MSDGPPAWDASAIGFEFESGAFVARADPEDDSLCVDRDEKLEGESCVDISANEVVGPLIGGRIIWWWSLTNNLGYRDGFQLSLRRDGADEVIVQLMVAASAVRLGRVELLR